MTSMKGNLIKTKWLKEKTKTKIRNFHSHFIQTNIFLQPLRWNPKMKHKKKT